MILSLFIKKKKKGFIDVSIESNLEILNANKRDVLRAILNYIIYTF